MVESRSVYATGDTEKDGEGYNSKRASGVEGEARGSDSAGNKLIYAAVLASSLVRSFLFGH